MNALDILKEVQVYLKTIPEINSCSIEVNFKDIQLHNINNTSLFISIMSHYSINKVSPESFTKLIEANIKHSLAMTISDTLYSFYKPFWFFPMKEPIKLDADERCRAVAAYSAEGII